jgi:hypothetical protein
VLLRRGACGRPRRSLLPRGALSCAIACSRRLPVRLLTPSRRLFLDHATSGRRRAPDPRSRRAQRAGMPLPCLRSARRLLRCLRRSPFLPPPRALSFPLRWGPFAPAQLGTQGGRVAPGPRPIPRELLANSVHAPCAPSHRPMSMRRRTAREKRFARLQAHVAGMRHACAHPPPLRVRACVCRPRGEKCSRILC